MCDQEREFNISTDANNLFETNQTMSGGNANNAAEMATENDNEVDRAVENIKYDISSFCDLTNEDKSDVDNNGNNNTLEEGLYDGDIAEIYLGNGVDSVERTKNSEISDSSLSEMTNSLGPIEENDGFSPMKSEGQVYNGYNNVFSKTENMPGALLNPSNHVGETRKRPLSPNDFTSNSSENKRIKTESVVYTEQTEESVGNGNTFNNEDVIDLCPPVAVVAPLGFSDDIIENGSTENKNMKSDSNSVKNDISSILDSFDEDDGKSLSLFDSVFEKMKTEIMEGQSFKTMDDGKWTFDEKPQNESDVNDHNVNKVNDSDVRNEKQNFLDKEKEICEKTELKRANSVEHDIEDFEKVLNSVIAKASRFPPGNESVVQKFNKIQSSSCTSIQTSVHTKQCKQPCNHVSNSDLLRELLDQKTDTNNAQTKSKQEIDLSFLHSDLISGKGLSVSSDKILQTRSIDPRLTSIPHVERTSNAIYSKPGQDGRGHVQQNGTKLQEGDHISLAEQRRASVTLHHKVPPNDMHQNHKGIMFNDINGDSSNIIKEAFDFATEISDLTNSESANTVFKPTNPLPFDPRHKMLPTGTFNPNMQNESYSNRNNYSQGLKIDPMQNHQMLHTSRMQQEMQSGNGLLTFAKQSTTPTSDSNLPPQLAGPFMSSPENSTARLHDFRQQQDPNQRSPFYSKGVDNMSSLGSRPNSGNGEIQPFNGEMQHFKSQFEPTQVNKIMHANSMQHTQVSQMDHFRNQRQNQSYGNQNISAGYPNPGAALVNQVSRTNIPDLGAQSQEKVPSYGHDPGMPMHYMNRGGMMPPENNYSMGMQERIRAMNVQQWYRRRIQAQINKQMPQQSMMMRQPMPQPMPQSMPQNKGMTSHVMSQGQGMGVHPNSHGIRMRQHQMYQGSETGKQMILPGQNMENRMRAMQAQPGHMNVTNIAENQRNQHFPHGQNQMNFEAQNLRQQMQYGQQMNQQNKMADSDAVNSMYMSRSFPTNGMVDNSKTAAAPIDELSQQFDIKREPFNAQSVQDMFPF